MIYKLPELLYNFSGKPLDPDFLIVKNIWRRAQVLTEFKSQVTIFTEITVGDGERPEDIATQYYGNPFYNWTILIINDITDYYAQWPRSVKQLQEYVENKYTNSAGTKHYITTEVTDDNGNVICPAGKIVPQTFQVAYYNGTTTVTANPTVSISNYQYEDELNAKKERIQIVRPEIIEDFVAVYKDLLTKNVGIGTQVGSTLSDISM